MTLGRYRLPRLLLVPCLLGLGGELRADDRKVPYQLHVVLHVARHRLLTDVFREQLERDLGDGLRAALGDLARVEVLRRHPRLDDVVRRGLERALSDWQERTPVKTHFVLVDYVAGRYEIQARQHDGPTGLAGPVVRRDRTRDRELVARTAALLVEHDLGLAGTVASEPDKQGRVQVRLQGGGLGVPLGRWVKKGEVFSLVRVAGGGAGQPVPWAALQVQGAPAKDGTCVCRLFNRYELARATGLRCVQLGTVTGVPLRLRVMEEKPDRTPEPLMGAVRLDVRRFGFDGEKGTLLREYVSVRRDVVDTSRQKDRERGRFDRLAFVSVYGDDNKLRARVPVPLVEDRLVLLPVPAAADEDTLIGYRLAALRRNVADSVLVQAELFRQINELTRKPDQRARALERVKEALQRSREDHERLSAERDELRREIDKLPDAKRPHLGAIGERLAQIKNGEDELRGHLAALQKIEREENDPKKKRWLEEKQRANLLVKAGELGQAIAIYEKAPKEFKTPDLEKYLAELQKSWKPKDDKHGAARRFIYNVWPGLDTAGLKARQKEAEDAFAVCRSAKDFVGPRKMHLGLLKHLSRLETELDALKPETNSTDIAPARLIKEVVPPLQKLEGELREYLAGD
jgi:hypothetical protein